MAWLALGMTTLFLTGGCATAYVIERYGKTSTRFDVASDDPQYRPYPSYGDATHLYVPGKLRIYSNGVSGMIEGLGTLQSVENAYRVFELKDGEILCGDPILGEIPHHVALEYPEVEKIYSKNLFIESGLDVGKVIHSDFYYFRNPNDRDNPYEIRVYEWWHSERSTAGKITTPLVFPIALVVDIVSIPVVVAETGFMFGCVFPILWSGAAGGL